MCYLPLRATDPSRGFHDNGPMDVRAPWTGPGHEGEQRMQRYLIALGTVVFVLALFMGCTGLLQLPGVYLFLTLMLLYSWVALAYFNYRYIRQEEFLHLLDSAIETEAPLAPTLFAYLRDRPRSLWRDFWTGLLLFMLLPGYYWFWHKRHRYEAKVERVAQMLRAGHSLSHALLAAPGVVDRETLLAVAVGEPSGQLLPCLRSLPRWRTAPLWIDATPRLLYPLVMLLVINAVLGFLMIFIIPKFEKIFADFKVALPEVTVLLIDFTRSFLFRGGWVALALLLFLGMTLMFFVSPSIYWRVPLLGRLYRMHAQGRVLKLISLLLEAGYSLPMALGLLADIGYFPGAVRRRLGAALGAVTQGEPLADSLRRSDLLPAAMAPLVQSAERAQHLPWALSELGDTLVRRALRVTERLTAAFFPLAVFLTGLVVGAIALALFLPLITLINEVGR